MDIYDKMVSLYYRWHRLEEEGKTSIIDFDLIRQGDRFPGMFTSRREVRETLNRIIEEYEAYEHQDTFIKEKLKGALNYLDALMGKQIPFAEYVQNTMGVKPVPIPRNRLEEEQEKAGRSMAELGYEYSKQGFEALEKETCFRDKDEIISSFNALEKKLVPMILDWLGLDVTPSYKIEFFREEAFWMNWILTDSKGDILLRFNIHPVQMKKWRKGSTEFFVFHEICCHALQSLSWRRRIENHHMPPFAGLTSLFTPEQFVSEGIAQTLYYFFPGDPFSMHGRLFLHVNNLRHMVSSNAHIMINEGEDPEDVYKYMEKYLPNLDKDFILKDLGRRASEPLSRTYQYIYGIGSYYHQELAKRLDKESRRNYVLDIFTTIRTPKNIMEEI
ncbi:MAG: hypothetical protein JRJ01_12550 [Deltaproteobacteria bacterium]|nr:hypothetical protein [Deltaproteobacteria bacterium]